jgi:hypothetical protein
MGKETLLPRSSLQDRKKKQQTQQRRSKRRKRTRTTRTRLERLFDPKRYRCSAWDVCCKHKLSAREDSKIQVWGFFVHRQALRNNPPSPPATLESPKRNVVAHKRSKHVWQASLAPNSNPTAQRPNASSPVKTTAPVSMGSSPPPSLSSLSFSFTRCSEGVNPKEKRSVTGRRGSQKSPLTPNFKHCFFFWGRGGVLAFFGIRSFVERKYL